MQRRMDAGTGLLRAHHAGDVVCDQLALAVMGCSMTGSVAATDQHEIPDGRNAKPFARSWG